MKKILAAVVTTVLLFGCQAEAPPPIDTIKPIDQATIAAVQLGYKSDPEMGSYNISVSAKMDHLILSGSVGSEEAKKKAEEMAKKSPAVKYVDNKLTVSE